MAAMVLALVAALAMAADPAPAEGTSEAAPAGESEPPAEAPAEPPPAPPPAAPARVVYDVVVVKKAEPKVYDVGVVVAAPAGTAPADSSSGAAAPAPAAPTLGGDITPAAAASATPPPRPPAEAPTPLPVLFPAEPAAVQSPPSPAGQPADAGLPASAAERWAAAAAAERTAAPPPEAAAPVSAAPAPPGVNLSLRGTTKWSVRDAAGSRYSTVQFARLVGDTATLRKLENERVLAKTGQIGVAVAAGGLLLASLVVATGSFGEPSITDYSVDPAPYATEEEYTAATDFAKGQYDKAVASWQEQRLGTALFLGGSGAICFAVMPFVGRDNDRREDLPNAVYTREEATRLIDAYNTAHPASPLPSDAAAAPPAAEAPAGAAPAPALPAEPVGVAPGVQVQPLVGVGFFGLRGAF